MPLAAMAVPAAEPAASPDPVLSGGVSVFSFSGVYHEENFWRELPGMAGGSRFFDFTELPGTNGYLSDEARDVIERALDTPAGRGVPARFAALPHAEDSGSFCGIHFIDSGNTHYMTKLFTDRIRAPFGLVLFDHHPDMLPASFGGLLSCGSWLRAALLENACLREAWLVGVDVNLAREAIAADGGSAAGAWEADAGWGILGALCADFAGKTLHLFPGALSGEEALSFAGTLSAQGLPFYLSLDKDVLAEEELATNWDQGAMRAAELFPVLSAIRRRVPLLGVDICGECDRTLSPAAYFRALEQNDRFNAKVLDILLNAR